MSDPNWLKLCIKLGGECKSCKIKDPDLWELDHILENGYLEREWFKTNGIEIFSFYLENFDEEKQYLQVFCRNCHKKKTISNRKNKSTVRFSDFKEFIQPFSEVNMENITQILKDNPILQQTFSHQIKMLVEITQKEGKIREEIKFTKIDIDFPLLKVFKNFFDTMVNGYTRDCVNYNQHIDDYVKEIKKYHPDWNIKGIKSDDDDEYDYLLIIENIKGLSPSQISKKFGEAKTKKYLKLMLSEGIIYESESGKYKLT